MSALATMAPAWVGVSVAAAAYLLARSRGVRAAITKLVARFAGSPPARVALIVWIGVVAVFGTVPAIVAALAAPVALSAVGKRRHRRRSAAYDRCAVGLAQALAAALRAGHSVHSALGAAAGSVDQPLRRDVERGRRQLALGYRADAVLLELAESSGSPRLATLVGALLMQRRSGGDLVRLLEELGESFRREDLTLSRARGATAQARFTAWIVIAAPLAVIAAVEMLHPGTLAGVLKAPPALLVLALATALHLVGALLVTRIARVGS